MATLCTVLSTLNVCVCALCTYMYVTLLQAIVEHYNLQYGIIAK